ncbi:hypothetical protein BJ322DRAFT_1060012 [Thelephora terrestris]|uniref:Uncharacterized protein n=1 Tax=Thelephora terrestris TaxID=56493 RepID=A0A9P6L8B8_9AGAM|nr:hypothetical protein BJ322DRAFT_1060012 [Thelephora terrestris]
MAVPLGRTFLAVLAASLVLCCVFGNASKWVRRTTARPRQAHKFLARRFWLPHSWELPNGCAIYPSHYRSSCYLRPRKDCERNHLKRWVASR